MPGTNEYSMGPEDSRELVTSKVNTPPTKTSPFYQERDFRQTKLQEMYGNNPTKRQLRKFNRYASSTQGQADELAFVKDESKKYLDSFSAYGDAALNRIRNVNKELALKAKTPVQSTPVTPPPTPPPPANDPIKDGGQKPFNTAFWDGRAKEGGFTDAAAVKTWQQQHGSKYGLVADGKFGPKTRAAYEQFKRDYQPLVEEDETNPTSPRVSTPITTPAIPSADALKRAAATFNNENYFRMNKAWGMPTVTIDGKTYQMRVTKGLKDGSGLINDESYAFDPDTGKVRRVAEYWSGAPKSSWAEGEDWIDLNGFADEREWLQNNPKPSQQFIYSGAGQSSVNPAYKQWETDYANKKKAWYKKQGGTMNRINYFQQGGTQSKPNGYKFTSRTHNFTPGYSVITQYMYPTYTRVNQNGETYEGWNDFETTSGRVIYNTPTQSDTVYYNTPDNYLHGEHSFDPIGTTKNQDAAKNRFYKFAKWSKPEDNEKSKEAHKRAIAGNKKGGIMNKVNYFQQGGSAPQQDIKTQVTALVQAAMQGDQKATQQVNQIMEAAKAGDQKAMQIAKLMEQVIKELQGQATSAKWGAKLGYIKSLKYAKGGKTCPTCEAKKVEMKACGGKKTKKRYFGGLV